MTVRPDGHAIADLIVMRHHLRLKLRLALETSTRNRATLRSLQRQIRAMDKEIEARRVGCQSTASAPSRTGSERGELSRAR